MSLEFRSVRIAVGEDGSGLLVFNGGWLIAVLVRLSSDHDGHEGHWFLETGYGRFSEGQQPIFVDQDAAAAWFKSSLADHLTNDPWTN